LDDVKTEKPVWSRRKPGRMVGTRDKEKLLYL